jgi:hypothetical protein
MTSALWDGTNGYVDHSDTDNLDHNVVVSLAKTADGATACTGLLISPRLVLTAASCKLDAKAGAAPYVRVGATTGSFTQVTSASSFLTSAANPAAEPSLSGQDVGLIVLKDYVFETARAKHPPLLAPTPTGSPAQDTSEPFANVVLTGWSPLNAGGVQSSLANHRQVIARDTISMWRYGRISTGNEPFWAIKPFTDQGTLKLGLAPGDNGAPLFTVDSSGGWNVIGIASIIGDPPDPNVRSQALPALGSDPMAGLRCSTDPSWSTPGSVTSCDAWVDVTASAVGAWLLANVRSTGLSHRWLSMHPPLRNATGRDQEHWIGDVDYAGPCDKVDDPDCDHIFTNNSDGSPRDNCPTVYNPDQTDTRDVGQGDACRSACAGGDVRQCPVPANGAATCDSTNQCGVACNTGYRACGGGCCPVATKIAVSSPVGVNAGVAKAGCALANGGVSCWQPLQQPWGAISQPAPVAGLTSGVTDISSSDYHTCVVANGGVQCWGRNTQGQLGNGTTTSSSIPVQVSSLTSGVTAVAAGSSAYLVDGEGSSTGEGSFSCAVVNGGVKCWGYNGHGQLGNGTTTSSSTPVSVVGLPSGATTVSAGGYHACAVVNGGAWCWGRNTGALGNGTMQDSSTPVQVTGLTSGVTAISAGSFAHTCAIVNGGLKCWGFNSSGELGDGTTNRTSAPIQVSGLTSGVTAVAAGDRYTCAVVNGAVKCWGWNWYGGLGDGTTTGSSTPVQATWLTSGAVAVSTSSFQYNCAIADGIQCWGNDGYLVPSTPRYLSGF